MLVARMRRLAPLIFLVPVVHVSARDDSLCESVTREHEIRVLYSSSSHVVCHLLFRTRCSPYPTIRCRLLSEEFVHLV